ncbi:MAG: hypothetical protein V1701_02925 [Planctomycetota bacterium]
MSKGTILGKTFISMPDGSIRYHPLLDSFQNYWVHPDPPNQLINIAANATVGPFPMTAREDGHIILSKMMCERTDEMTIRLYDKARSSWLSNNEVHIDTLVGNGGLPSRLFEDMFVPATGSMLVQFRDLSGAPNAVRFAFGGAKIYHKQAPAKELKDFLGQKRLLTFPYFLTPDNGFFTIAANGVSTQFATGSSDFDIEIHKINAVFDEDFTYEIRMRGDSLSNGGEIHCNIGTGTGQLPYVLPQPIILKWNETMELRFTNLSPINPNVVWFTMIGRAIVLNK